MSGPTDPNPPSLESPRLQWQEKNTLKLQDEASRKAKHKMNERDILYDK